jgi:hypothetical protein
MALTTTRLAAQVDAEITGLVGPQIVQQRVAADVLDALASRMEPRGATRAFIGDWPAGEGAALLDRLLRWAIRALPFELTSQRLMHRTTLAGEEAVA